MAEIIKAATQHDLAEFIVIEACARLGVTPHGEFLVASASQWDRAHLIAAKYGMVPVMLPKEMLGKNADAWAVITRSRGMFWSEGGS